MPGPERIALPPNNSLTAARETHHLHGVPLFTQNLATLPVRMKWFAAESCDSRRRENIMNAFIGRLGFLSAFKVGNLNEASAPKGAIMVNVSPTGHKSATPSVSTSDF